jgi:hypothetical protein
MEIRGRGYFHRVLSGNDALSEAEDSVIRPKSGGKTNLRKLVSHYGPLVTPSGF